MDRGILKVPGFSNRSEKYFYLIFSLVKQKTDTVVKILLLWTVIHDHSVPTNLLDKRHYLNTYVSKQNEYKEDSDPILGDLRSISTWGRGLFHWLAK